MSYQPMPSAPPPGPPPARGPAPSSVTMAVRLMLLNAAIGIISVIVLFATKDTLRDEIRDNNLDIISVCSWHGQHAPMTIAAAARRPKAIPARSRWQRAWVRRTT